MTSGFLKKPLRPVEKALHDSLFQGDLWGIWAYTPSVGWRTRAFADIDQLAEMLLDGVFDHGRECYIDGVFSLSGGTMRDATKQMVHLVAEKFQALPWDEQRDDEGELLDVPFIAKFWNVGYTKAAS